MKSHRMTLAFLLLVVIVVVVIVFVLAQMSVKQTLAYARADLLVKTEWIKTHKVGEEYVLVDVRSSREYGREHAEGAVSVPWQEFFEEGKFLGERCAEVLGKAGIRETDEVVVAGDEETGGTAIAFWVLDYLGHEKLHVLAEPVGELKSEGVAFVKAATRREPVKYQAKVQADRLVEKTEGEVTVLLMPLEEGRGEGLREVNRLQQLWRASSGGTREMDAYAAEIRGKEMDPKGRVVVCAETWQGVAPQYLVLRVMGYERVGVCVKTAGK